jgi:hypothetical protein
MTSRRGFLKGLGLTAAAVAAKQTEDVSMEKKMEQTEIYTKPSVLTYKDADVRFSAAYFPENYRITQKR